MYVQVCNGWMDGWMYVCMYVCMQVGMYVCIYIYTHTYIYIYREREREEVGLTPNSMKLYPNSDHKTVPRNIFQIECKGVLHNGGEAKNRACGNKYFMGLHKQGVVSIRYVRCAAFDDNVFCWPPLLFASPPFCQILARGYGARDPRFERQPRVCAPSKDILRQTPK